MYKPFCCETLVQAHRWPAGVGTSERAISAADNSHDISCHCQRKLQLAPGFAQLCDIRGTEQVGSLIASALLSENGHAPATG
jgi:hypothetical protein